MCSKSLENISECLTKWLILFPFLSHQFCNRDAQSRGLQNRLAHWNATTSLFAGHPRTGGSAQSLLHRVLGNASKQLLCNLSVPSHPRRYKPGKANGWWHRACKDIPIPGFPISHAQNNLQELEHCGAWLPLPAGLTRGEPEAGVWLAAWQGSSKGCSVQLHTLQQRLLLFLREHRAARHLQQEQQRLQFPTDTSTCLPPSLRLWRWRRDDTTGGVSDLTAK